MLGAIPTPEVLIQIKHVSVMVEDQGRALDFYMNVLGFSRVADIPVGEYQKALLEAGIPATAFVTNDIRADFVRLKSLGVVFRGEPVAAGTFIAVAFEDTCGNLIQLVQPAA